jgi:hypothetical protein
MIETEPKKINNSLAASRDGGQAPLERLLKENIELNKKIYESCQKTEKYIHFIKAFNIFKFVIILVPIVLGVLYVVPLLGGFIDMYRDLFASAGEATGLLETMKDLQGLNGL